MFYGEDVTQIPASERKAGFAFQHYALFRHMSVFENIAFGLRVRPKTTRPPENEIRARVEKLLKLIQLEPLAKRFPSQLSGGQRQRVALARALAVEPKVLLLDEPFGALDAKVRKELRRWLRQLHDEIHITTLFVTHDQEEALEVADRVAILRDGKIEQIGTPEEIYDHPASPFVYDFLGNVNLFSGRVQDGAVVDWRNGICRCRKQPGNRTRTPWRSCARTTSASRARPAGKRLFPRASSAATPPGRWRIWNWSGWTAAGSSRCNWARRSSSSCN